MKANLRRGLTGSLLAQLPSFIQEGWARRKRCPVMDMHARFARIWMHAMYSRYPRNSVPRSKQVKRACSVPLPCRALGLAPANVHTQPVSGIKRTL